MATLKFIHNIEMKRKKGCKEWVMLFFVRSCFWSVRGTVHPYEDKKNPASGLLGVLHTRKYVTMSITEGMDMSRFENNIEFNV